jgi:UDP-glucose 4-epimerase
MDITHNVVLITGGAGFVGSHIADQLLTLGCKVTVFDNLDPFYGAKQNNYAHNLENRRYRFIQGDILDENALADAMKGHELVFHQAAQAGVRYCIDQPVKAHQVNVTGTLNVLLAAKDAGVKKIVYASSSSVYGATMKVPMLEEHPTQPTSIYGATKLAAEKYCHAMEKTGGVKATSLRYFSVYGPRGRPDQIIHAFADQVSQGKRPIIYGDGSVTRDFTFVSDIVTAAIFAAESEEADGQVLNVGYGKEISVLEVAEKVLARMQSNLRPEFKPAYAGDFPRTFCSNEKAKRLLRWRPVVGFDEGLDKFLQWYRSRHSAPTMTSRGHSA